MKLSRIRTLETRGQLALGVGPEGEAQILNYYKFRTDMAKAQLISAAPEMLEALKGIMDVEDKWESALAWQKVEEAIANAERSGE